jgi:hypothetical protein
MSLLDSWTDNITIFPEEVVTDEDGNIKTRPSAVGYPAKARIQPVGMSGTSGRRAEQDNEGFEGEKIYSLRLQRQHECLVNAQAQIEWRGKRWAVFGDAFIYNSSPRTAHVTYTIKRF